VIVDLYNVTRLAPSAVGALVRADRLARRRGQPFAVECARGQAAAALRDAHLPDVGASRVVGGATG
jgi:hypothetical protein